MKEINLETEQLKIKINGKVYAVEADNVDVMEKVIKFDEAVGEIGQRLQNGKNASEAIRELCNTCMQAADGIFGQGSAKRIFGKSVNFMKCVKFAKAVLPVITEYYNSLAKELNVNG